MAKATSPKKDAKKEAPDELEHKLPFERPSLEFVMKMTEPMRKYFTPEFYGLENVDKDKPGLYVHNHSVFGLFDGQLLGAELYKEKDIFLRSLVDNVHFELPVWRDLLSNIGGGVKGTRENCAELMRQGEHILVFPGGGREVCKKKGEKYKLTWKSRSGFARMAMEFGYPLIPVAGLGGDDAYSIIWDSDDVMNSKLGEFLKRTGIAEKFLKNGEHIPPFTKGIGPTLFPKPMKFYYKVCEPIDTTEYKDRFEDKEAQMELRTKVELALDKAFIELMEIRQKDQKNLSPLRKFLNNL